MRLLKRIPQEIAQPPWPFRETLGTAERTKVRQQAIVLRMPTQGSHLQGVHGGITQGLAILMLKKHVWYEGTMLFLRVQIKCAWIFKYIHTYGIQRNKKCTASERLGSPTEVLRYTALPCCPVQSLWPSLLLMSLEDLPHTHGPNVLGHQQLWEFRDWSKSITPYFLRGRTFIHIYINTYLNNIYNHIYM